MATNGVSWRSEALGPADAVRVGGGTIRYHATGSGSPAVFVHGVLVNANLWRKVVDRLATDLRCVTLDLPFGAHLEPIPPTADLSPPAVADLIADTLDALDLEDVTLVGNDTGGAFSQLVAARRPERIGRLVLTSCDAFDNFPPKALKPAMPVLRLPGALAVLYAPMRLGPARRRALTLTRLTKRPVEPRAVDSYMLPAATRSAIRRDARKLLAGVDSRYTLDAADRLRAFDRPALIAWSREDKFFPTSHAERLAALLPDARLEWIDDSYTFSPEDQPDRLASLIGDFVGDAGRTAPRAAPA